MHCCELQYPEEFFINLGNSAAADVVSMGGGGGGGTTDADFRHFDGSSRSSRRIFLSVFLFLILTG